MFTHGKYELEFAVSGSDGIHPSQEFFKNYTAPQIAQFLRDNYKKPQTDFSNMTYLAFGDSITYGLENYGLEKSRRMEKPYTTLVSEDLGLKSYSNLGQNGATFCVNNNGHYNMTESILSCNISADIVSVMLGVNDFIQGLPLGSIDDKDNTTIYGSLYLICEYLSENYADSFVFFMTPLKVDIGSRDSFTINSQGYNLQDVANAIKQVAHKYNYPVLDLFTIGEFECEMYDAKSDGVHPSQSFIQNYTAPQIAQFIKDNYKN